MFCCRGQQCLLAERVARQRLHQPFQHPQHPHELQREQQKERAALPAAAALRSSTAAAPEPSMTSVSTTTVTDPSSVNTESAGVEDAESSQGGKPAQLEPGNDLTAEEEALLACIACRSSTRSESIGRMTEMARSPRS